MLDGGMIDVTQSLTDYLAIPVITVIQMSSYRRPVFPVPRPLCDRRGELLLKGSQLSDRAVEGPFHSPQQIRGFHASVGVACGVAPGVVCITTPHPASFAGTFRGIIVCGVHSSTCRLILKLSLAKKKKEGFAPHQKIIFTRRAQTKQQEVCFKIKN